MSHKPPQSRRLFHFSYAVQLMFAVIIFWVTTWVATGGIIGHWEEVVFHAVYDLPSWLWLFFITITQLGNIWVLLALAALLLLNRNRLLTLRLLIGGLAAYMISGFAKGALGRPRPDGFIFGLVLRDFSWGPGFPSGHMALATAIALIARPHIPGHYRWVVLPVIALVGLSRIYLGVHAPMDVVGGFAIGWAVAAVVMMASERASRQTKKA